MQPNENNPENPTPRASTSRRIRLILSYAIAGACLAWVLYNVHPKHLMQSIVHLKWQYVLLAIIADNTNYISQGVRWKVLLLPVAPVKIIKSIQATYVAMFTSNVLPMRIGEIVRAYLISKWYLKPFSEIIPSMVLEHMFEGIWLAIGIVSATLFVPSPAYLKRGAEVFGIGVILLAVLFVYALVRKEESALIREREYAGLNVTQKLRLFVEHIAVGMRKIGLSRCFFVGFGITLFSLFMQVLALLLVGYAYGLHMPLWKAGVVLLIIRVGVVIPNAPANLGAYQFFAALGLQLLGVDRHSANGFALILFIVLMAPTWVTGFFALSQSGTTLLRLQHEARDAAGTD